ncbi:hypothetical protein AC1031_004235 [Aphanomyces cochlioides]|nr:hypothetical protein AC1031_004235 [Aphanomyces cochlioides]
MTLAAQNGHMEIVQWLHINRDEVCRISLFHSSAIHEKALEMVEWLCVNRRDVDPDEILHDAVLGNRIAIIELLVDRFGVPWSSRHTKTVVRLGYLTILRWIQGKDPRINDALDQSDLKKPITKGDLPMVQWLCEVVGLEFSDELLQLATSYSHTRNILEWLVETNRLDSKSFEEYLAKPHDSFRRVEY